MEEVLECCGMPMIYQEFFGIRRYVCYHRYHHPQIFVNLYTGDCISDENLDWNQQVDDTSL